MSETIATFSDLFVTIFTLAIGWLSYWYYKNFYYPRHLGPLKDIPGPSNELWSTLRYIHYRFTGDEGRMYKDLHERYGPIVHSGLGVISVIDPVATKQIYSGYKFTKVERYENFHEHVQNLMSTRMIAPSFNWNTLNKLEPIISFHSVDSLMNTINRAIDQGANEVDMYDLYHKATLDVVSELVLGKSYNSLNQPNFPAYQLSNHISDTWGLKFAIPLLTFMKARHHPLITNVVVECLRERRIGKTKNDILQILIDVNSDTNQKFTDAEVIEEASLLLLTGVETTSMALIWTTYLLLKNPQTYQKLIQELIVNFPEKDMKITFNQCKDLPYLNAVLHESLRLKSPVAGVLPRVVPPGGTTLCGYYLPEGTIVGTGAYAFHHSEQHWPNAEAFIPERWLGPESDTMKSNLLAFSFGATGCVGKNLAWMQLCITLANFLRNFDCRISKDTDLTPFDLLVLKAKERELNVLVTKREG